ncbi:cytochrome b561 [Escherichia coli]
MENKYSRLQISIHWLVFLLVIAAYCAMRLRGFFPRSDRPLINMVHVSCGISILVLMVVRLLLRLKYPTPPIIPKPKPMMTGLAHLGHLVIYLLFIALPVIGLVMMYNRGKSVVLRSFDDALRFRGRSEAAVAESWHETLANLGYFVIGLHAAAALAHHYFWKDNTLLRMMPRKRS